MNAPTPFLTLAVLLGSPLLGQSWPMYQGNAAHTGALPHVLIPGSLKKLWTVPNIRTGYGGFTAADGLVALATGAANGAEVFDGSTGKLLWRKTYPGRFDALAPVLHDGKLLLRCNSSSTDAELRQFDAKTGTELYKKDFISRLGGTYAPTLFDGDLYCHGGQSSGGLIRLQGATGTQVWHLQLPSGLEWTPAVDAQRVYVYEARTVFIADRQTGSLVDSFADPGTLGSGYFQTPVLGGRGDLLIADDGRLVSFSLAGRGVRWEVFGSYYGPVAVGGGVVYVANDDELEARDQMTGALLWSWPCPTGSLNIRNLVLTGAHVLTASRTTTYLVDLDTHQSVATLDDAGHCILADKRIYVVGAKGLSAYAFDELPGLVAVGPGRVHHAVLPARLRIRGSGFLTRPVQVHVGGRLCQGLKVIDDETLECIPPDLGPGFADVRVSSSLGGSRLSSGIVYTPALAGPSMPTINTTVEFRVSCNKGDHIILCAGLPLAPAVQIPGIAARLHLRNLVEMALAYHWYSEEFVLRLAAPNDPALRGLRLGIQALTATTSARLPPSFSNPLTVQIQ